MHEFLMHGEILKASLWFEMDLGWLAAKMKTKTLSDVVSQKFGGNIGLGTLFFPLFFFDLSLLVFNGFPMLFHISRSEITVILCLLEKFL